MYLYPVYLFVHSNTLKFWEIGLILLRIIKRELKFIKMNEDLYISEDEFLN